MLSSNKNIQEPIQVHISPSHKKSPQIQKQCLKFNACQCSLCQKKDQQNFQDFKDPQRDDNKFQQFLKYIPSNFPLFINPTTVYNCQGQGYHMHYFNGTRTDNKSFIYKNKTSKLLINFPIAQNIRIFGNNFSKIVAKYQTLSFLRKLQQNPTSSFSKKSLISQKSKISYYSAYTSQNPEDGRNQSNCSSKLSSKFTKSKVLYIQAYNQQIPIKVHYDKSLLNVKLDPILQQYLDDQYQNFEQKDNNKSYTINQQFWQWVYTQYGQQTFAYFVSEFYARVYQVNSKNIIEKAIFYWIFQKPKKQFGQNTKVVEQLGRHKSMLQAQYFIAKIKKLGFKLKIANIKNAKIQYHRNIKTFQQEYQELILQKINSTAQQSTQSLPQLPGNKLQAANKKNYLYQNRLDTFQSKVRDLFLKEQNSVLNKVQSEKQYEGKQDSTKLARLLLPNMGEYQSIRDILNDQFAFQNLILFGERKKQKQRLQRARQNLLGQARGKSVGDKHMYQQSRIRKKETSSRRIRVRTQA